MLPAAATVAVAAAAAAVPSLKESSVAVYNLVQNLITSASHDTISTRLRGMDLEARTKVIEALVNDLDDIRGDKCESVKAARFALNETMIQLRIGLESLNVLRALHSKAWFPSFWYSAQMKDKLALIEQLSDRLEKRTELLTRIIPLVRRR
jgi:hypothetical protein